MLSMIANFDLFFSSADHQLLLRKAPGNNHFVLQHMQATSPVLYSANGWLKACRESPTTRAAASLLQESSREEMSKLFVSCRGAGISCTLGGLHGVQRGRAWRRIGRHAPQGVQHPTHAQRRHGGHEAQVRRPAGQVHRGECECGAVQLG